MNTNKSPASQAGSGSELISKRIAELGDWRGKTLGRMRALIKQADPDVVEEWKWVKASHPGTPVWPHNGIICTGESYKSVVKLTFAKGASLKDPARLFSSSLDGNVRRAIDIHEGEDVDESAFKALVRQAFALNRSGKSKPSKSGDTRSPRRRQPADRKGRRRRARADRHRRDAWLETRRGAPPRRAHRTHRPRRAQGRQVELPLLWHRRPGMVPQLSLLHEVRQGGVLPRRIAASSSARRVQ